MPRSARITLKPVAAIPSETRATALLQALKGQLGEQTYLFRLAVYPPSTTISLPVMNDASSEARNRTALAISSRTGRAPEQGGTDQFAGHLRIVCDDVGSHGGCREARVHGIDPDIVLGDLGCRRLGQ